MPRSGVDTKRRILDTASNRASVIGLDGVTIGRLAAEVGVSNGAVANHFPSKDELQLGTIAHAAAVVQGLVADRSLVAEPGLPRLRAVLDAWLAYLADPPFDGGCFFCTTTAEFGSRPGEIRDVLASAARAGLDLLLEQARLAQRLGEVNHDEPAEQLVFELHAYLQEANWARRLLDDDDAIDKARTAIENRLQRKDYP